MSVSFPAPACAECGTVLSEHWQLFAHLPRCETAEQWVREHPRLQALKGQLGTIQAKLYGLKPIPWRREHERS